MSIEIKEKTQATEVDSPIVQKIAKYSGLTPEEVVYTLRHASEKGMSIQEIQRWLDSIAYAVEERIREKYGISGREIEINVVVDPTGKYNSLEPYVNLGDYRIVLKDLIWDAHWGDLLCEDDSVESLEEWVDDIVETYQKLKKQFGAQEKS